MTRDIETELAKLDQLAYILENAVPIPGTDIRFGLDAVAGFVPVLGDTIMLIPASVILQRAHAYGVSRRLMVRMGLNLAIDVIIGMVPLFGDIFDVGWNANTRNVKLLRDYLQTSGQMGTPIAIPA